MKEFIWDRKNPNADQLKVSMKVKARLEEPLFNRPATDFLPKERTFFQRRHTRRTPNDGRR